MLESARNAPQFSLTFDAELGPLQTAREKMKEAGQNLSLTALIIHLTAKTLRERPLLNASFEDDGISVFESTHIRVATAAQDGLRVPVIHDAGALGLEQIKCTLADLSSKARETALESFHIEP